MLGIRKQNGVALDLFQGATSLLSADLVLDQVSGAMLKNADIRGIRHVAIVHCDMNLAVSCIKEFLSDLSVPKSLRRISFIVSSSEEYRASQDVLFNEFPEQDE